MARHLDGGLSYIDEPLVLKKPGGVANLEPAADIHNRYLGTRIRDLEWMVTDCRQFAADLDRVDRPDRSDIAAAVEERLTWAEYQLGLARASRLERIGRLGPALRACQRRHLKMWAIYATAPMSLRVMTWRRARRTRRAGA